MLLVLAACGSTPAQTGTDTQETRSAGGDPRPAGKDPC